MVVKEFSADLFTFFSRDINVEKKFSALDGRAKAEVTTLTFSDIKLI